MLSGVLIGSLLFGGMGNVFGGVGDGIGDIGEGIGDGIGDIGDGIGDMFGDLLRLHQSELVVCRRYRLCYLW